MKTKVEAYSLNELVEGEYKMLPKGFQILGGIGSDGVDEAWLKQRDEDNTVLKRKLQGDEIFIIKNNYVYPIPKQTFDQFFER